jgi:hypothetical protein
MFNALIDCSPATDSSCDASIARLNPEGCQPCPAGFLCYGATNTDRPLTLQYNNGEKCPKGYYCPEGSYEPTPCAVGSYNKNFGAGVKTDCDLCPAGTSQSDPGQEGCSPCGQFADSVEGAEVCTCIGNNRVYSPVDNSCRCKTGFDFKVSGGISEGQSSDVTDCIPLVLDRCDADGVVRSPTGECKDLTDCTAECAPGDGIRDKILGVCTCANTPTTDEICNQDCRANAPKIGMKS